MKPLVFVDMDETLLHYDLYSGRTYVRPGAFEALQALRTCTEVWVFSAGLPPYVRDRLTETGLGSHVDGVVTTWDFPENWRVGSRKWVLLDNDAMLAEMKCEMIDPNGRPCWIEVEDFTSQPSATPLTAYLPTVWRALS